MKGKNNHKKNSSYKDFVLKSMQPSSCLSLVWCLDHMKERFKTNASMLLWKIKLGGFKVQGIFIVITEICLQLETYKRIQHRIYHHHQVHKKHETRNPAEVLQQHKKMLKKKKVDYNEIKCNKRFNKEPVNEVIRWNKSFTSMNQSSRFTLLYFQPCTERWLQPWWM